MLSRMFKITFNLLKIGAGGDVWKSMQTRVQLSYLEDIEKFHRHSSVSLSLSYFGFKKLRFRWESIISAAYLSSYWDYKAPIVVAFTQLEEQVDSLFKKIKKGKKKK